MQNGMKLPGIGFGTAELPNDGSGTEKVLQALGCGYRLLDTASVYGNEEAIGDAIKRAETQQGITRQDLIISSKLANEAQGYQSALDAFDATLNRLRLDYLDIYLIHWPIPKGKEEQYRDLNKASWEAMEKLYGQGKIKMIGVCNFLQRHLENLMQDCMVFPQVNQIEVHPRYQQRELIQYCREKQIIVEAWGPFRNGRIFGEKTLQNIAGKHGATTAQVCLKWISEQGLIPLPKSSSLERMKENLRFGTVALDALDRKMIADMDDKDGHADYWNYKRQLEY